MVKNCLLQAFRLNYRLAFTALTQCLLVANGGMASKVSMGPIRMMTTTPASKTQLPISRNFFIPPEINNHAKSTCGAFENVFKDVHIKPFTHRTQTKPLQPTRHQTYLNQELFSAMRPRLDTRKL